MDSFLLELAQAQPDPGGGAAAAFGANLGLALLEKVVQLEGQRRPKRRATASLTWEEALGRIRRLTENLRRLQEEDVRAYGNLTAARASRDAATLAAAARAAVSCPGEIMLQAGEALKLLAWAGGHCQKHLVSDLLVAGEFLMAALRGAYHIAAANLPLVLEEEECRALKRELGKAIGQGEDFYHQAKAALVVRENGFDRCRG